MNKPIRMFWWRGVPNIGDSFNPYFIKALFGLDVEWADVHEAELHGAGSLMQIIARVQDRIDHESHVWGCGYMQEETDEIVNEKIVLDVVRGRISQELSGHSVSTLGDPGILANLVITQPFKQYAIGVIPHFTHYDDQHLNELVRKTKNAVLIDVREHPLSVIETIASCDFVVSSSLHGLIIADSFGVPSRWLRITPELLGLERKFRDYYSVYDIPTPDPVMLADVDDLVNLEEEAYIPADVSNIQQSLLAAFPFVKA